MTAPTNLYRTATTVRELSADDLGIGASQAAQSHGSNRPDEPKLDPAHPLVALVRRLLRNYGGVIFAGPPGTSKSFYANQIGLLLSDHDEDRIRFVQFHPSFQYEDFMQGFVPNKSTGNFELTDKTFVNMCKNAQKAIDAGRPGELHVLVIDEFSRADPGRVFGEALTYMEDSKRGISFSLASGDGCVVPKNLIILATMNPWDRGVDEVEAAFDRRFARIAMDPDRAILEKMLGDNGLEETLLGRVLGWFSMMQGHANGAPLAAIGHAYFSDVVDAESLQLLWDHQLRFVVEKAFALDRETRANVTTGWASMFRDLPEDDDSDDDDDGGGHDDVASSLDLLPDTALGSEPDGANAEPEALP